MKIFKWVSIMLYERIQGLCKNHGISIPKLEDELGFGGGTISKWKTSSPGSDKLVKVAIYFRVSTDYLLGLNNGMQCSEAEGEILLLFRDLNPTGQGIAIGQVKSLTEQKALRSEIHNADADFKADKEKTEAESAS